MNNEQIAAHLTLLGWRPVGVGASQDISSWRGMTLGTMLVWWYIHNNVIGHIDMAGFCECKLDVTEFDAIIMKRLHDVLAVITEHNL